MVKSHRNRRSSSRSSMERRGSVSSVSSSVSDLLVEENNYEMYSGAPSEVIPSSISSLHYPHRFGRFGSRQNSTISGEASPLLNAAPDPTEGGELYSIRSNATANSAESPLAGSAGEGGFKFFSADEIETAQGGSTIENPDDRVDYNTNWDYSNYKFDNDDENEGLLSAPHRSSQLSEILLNQQHQQQQHQGEERMAAGSRDRISPTPSNQDDSSYGSMNSTNARFERRNNRRFSNDSDKSSNPDADSNGSLNFQKSNGGDDYYYYNAFNPKLDYQRYYLAEEDLVIGIAGYKTKILKQTIFYLICICTFGLGYLVFRWFPRYRINFLGDRTPLGLADWVVIENEFGELIIIDINKQRLNERLSSFLVLPDKNVEKDDDILEVGHEGVEIEAESEVVDPTIPYLHSFTYRYIKFFYSPVEDIFRTNSNWYDNSWLSLKHTGDGVSQALHEQRMQIFGENNIDIEEKTIFQLLVDEVLHPFYMFQVFSIFLWLADDYYYYASCIFIISLVSVANTLAETKSTIRRLKQISKFTCEIRVWRNHFWKQIDSNELVPGDVFEVDPSLAVVPCDALLINGECVINESMLTGESVPVSKVEANQDTLDYLKENFTSPVLAKSFLYNGTKLLKMKSHNEEPVTAVCIKTGFNTTKGSLVRSMLFPKPVGFKFYEDSFKYIGFMAIIAALGFIYSTYNFIQIGLDKKVMVLRALDIITIVVPPALPATLTIGTTFAINRLKAKQIFCISPTRVNVGGKIDVFCFDKTGTLTEDGLDILGVHVANNATGRKEIIFEDLIPEVKQLTKSVDTGKHSTNNNKFLLSCMASCHSLRLIDDELLGDPLDAKMFEFTKWNFEENYVSSSGATFQRVYPNAGNDGFITLKEYEFLAALRRMSVLVKEANAFHDEDYYVFTKGAPEVMSDICDKESLPTDYDQILHHYTHNGFRVIACAYKSLKRKDISMKALPGRDDIERDLTFAGFIIFENKLKGSTKATLDTLNKAKIRTVMCTGDNILTAISVSKECNLVDQDTKIYIPTYEEGSNITNLVWQDVHNSENKLDSITLTPLHIDHRSEPEDYKLAITGDVFKYLLTEVQLTSVTQKVLMSCDIFARMSPDEKHELVEQLQKIDYTVGFCGDGANDCGALKAADVGISLSEAEASVAAPFTSRLFEISCVLDVIKEGRSSLVTSFSCFKYMSLYSAIQFVTVSILYKTGTNLGDFQFLYIDMFLILPLAIFMSWSKPYEKIVIKRPTANLVSPKVLIPLCCNILVILIFQVGLWFAVQEEPWYIKPVPGSDDAVQSSDNTVLFLFTNFQYILIAIVLSSGPPYREPMNKNIPFLVNVVVACLLSAACFLIEGDSWWGNFMQLTDMPTFWYWIIVLAAALNLAVMLLGEKYWFGNLARVYKRVFKRNAKSRKLFKNLNREFESREV
ncbi:vacuolar cation-transporting ATPase Ypk9p [[Candida] railenensis]|uniref:Cation-transporting ATPase n=1 Tax=[Candida] railenensis TaxID=45579 RepID=A0A9P0W1G7_9ASCO|nr:vacuolar cation-transporting ATPase Ypk9p [[Candida] railenensis]